MALVDEERRDAGQQMWKSLIDRFVPIEGYCPRDFTSISRMVELAPQKFMGISHDRQTKKSQRNKEHLNWSSVRMLRSEVDDVSLLETVEKGIRLQSAADSLHSGRFRKLFELSYFTRII